MKYFLFATAFMGLALTLKAQEGTVTLEQDPRIDSLVYLYTEVNTEADAEVGFYQIQVGFGNYRNALILKGQVDADFPELGSRIAFESPTYRVRLGQFKTKLEAERRYLQVREKYPDAMLLKPEK